MTSNLQEHKVPSKLNVYITVIKGRVTDESPCKYMNATKPSCLKRKKSVFTLGLKATKEHVQKLDFSSRNKTVFFHVTVNHVFTAARCPVGVPEWSETTNTSG